MGKPVSLVSFTRPMHNIHPPIEPEQCITGHGPRPKQGGGHTLLLAERNYGVLPVHWVKDGGFSWLPHHAIFALTRKRPKRTYQRPQNPLRSRCSCRFPAPDSRRWPPTRPPFVLQSLPPHILRCSIPPPALLTAALLNSGRQPPPADNARAAHQGALRTPQDEQAATDARIG